MRRIGVWKLVSAAKALTKQQVKLLLYAALFIWALLVIDHVGTGRRTALMVTLFGPIGALWVFRTLLVIFIALLIWSAWSTSKHDRRLQRMLERRHCIDKSIRQDV